MRQGVSCRCELKQNVLVSKVLARGRYSASASPDFNGETVAFLDAQSGSLGRQSVGYA